MRGFRPDIIHAEEEPDSLAALQIALARRLWAPGARLVLYSWQNVDRPKKPWVKAVMRATFRAADAVLCASEEALQVLWANGYSRRGGSHSGDRRGHARHSGPFRRARPPLAPSPPATSDAWSRKKASRR